MTEQAVSKVVSPYHVLFNYRRLAVNPEPLNVNLACLVNSIPAEELQVMQRVLHENK